MTLYADPETRKTWRIDYGIIKLESAQDAFEFWQRRGGGFPGCVLALAHAVEQIDADEDLMRQALEALENVQEVCTEDECGRIEAATVWTPEIIAVLRERLK